MREKASRHVRQCVVCGRKFMGYHNSMMCSDRCRAERSLALNRENVRRRVEAGLPPYPSCATKDEWVESARKAVAALTEEQREGLRLMFGRALGRSDG